MNQYNVFQAIVMSFYSRKLYRDVATNWGGKSFLYLLLIVALSWIFATYLLQHTLNQGFSHNSDRFIAQIPVLTIKDGKISTPENRPYIINDPDNNKQIAIIDTTGKYTTLESAQTSVLVTQTAVISQSKPNEIRTDQIPSTLNAVIDPQVVKNYIKDYIGYVWIAIFIFAVICAYVYRIIQALLYSIIGKIFSAICGKGLTYGQIVQIAMVAITPAIVLACIIEAFKFVIPYPNLICFALAMVYLFYGVLANNKKV